MRFVRLDVRPIGGERSGSLVGFLCLGLVVLLWGSGPVAIGVGVSAAGGFGPLWLASTRILLAGVILLGVGRLRGYRVWPERGPWRAAVAGLIGWSIGNGAQVFAQTEVAASVAALVVGLSPAFAVALDAAWARRWPAVHHAIAVALGLAGLAVLVGGGGTGDAAIWAVGLLALAAAGWAAASVLERHRPVRAAPSLSAGWQMVFGGLGLLVAALVGGEPLPSPTTAGWIAWAWLALACAGVGFLAWIEVLRRLPVALAMTQPTLSTVVAVGLGAYLLGESLPAGAVPGVLLAVGGAALAAIPERAPWRALLSRLGRGRGGGRSWPFGVSKR
jgi:drug/metabolite transporter (DMT)-like permease